MEEQENRSRQEQANRGRTVLITGGSRGIGAACARIFAKRGDRIIIGYNKSRAAAEALAEELNEGCGDRLRAAALRADVTSKKEVNAMFESARKIFGRIDVLVNNAGISEYVMFTDISQDQWDLMMDTNCRGMFFCAQEALQDMISERKGTIVNVSSMWGQVGSSCEVHYSASKAAVIGLTKALAKELGPNQVRVNCVAPGVIETDMLEGISEEIKGELAEETPLMRLGSPEDIARVIYFLASDDAAFITGQVVGASGGFVI